MNWLPCADKAQAEDRVREAENRVAELLALDSRGGLSSPGAGLWEAMEVLRLARADLERLEFEELTRDLRAQRRPKATSRPRDPEDEPLTEGERPPDVA